MAALTEGMRRIRMIISYDGTAYCGWQVQPNGTAVQQLIEEAITAVTGEHVPLHGSGRTDSGVHARAQVAHFDTGVRMAADKFAIALNTHLPRDIRILYSEEAPAEFHSRFTAKEKEYHYRIQLGPHALVDTRNTALHYHYPLDLGAMRAAAADVVGTHDFRGFMSTGTHVEDTVRTVYRSEWMQDGPYLTYSVTGNGFLYNMVRILAGTMISIGKGDFAPDAMNKAIESGNRLDAGPTAPAHGLTLWRVRYEGFDTEEILNSVFCGEQTK